MLKGYFYKKEKKNPGEPGSGNQDGAAQRVRPAQPI